MSDCCIKGIDIDNKNFYLASGSYERYMGVDYFGNPENPTTKKERLEWAIQAASKIYYELQDEYYSLFGKEY